MAGEVRMPTSGRFPESLSSAERALLNLIDPDEVVQLTRELVRIDSVIRPETGNTEAKVVAFIADWIRENLGIDPLVEEVVPGRENIIVTVDFGDGAGEGNGAGGSAQPGGSARTDGSTTNRVLMLEGHTDVVSEGERDRWTYDPFGAEIVEGKLYGRGSCDMKAGVAVNLITAKTLLAATGRAPDGEAVSAGKGDVTVSPFYPNLSGKLRLGIVCDEEGMMIGIKDYIKRGHADDVTACLVSEPEENQLCITMKGGIRAIVRVTGKMAHGAMPLTGINASTRMARVILAFDEYEQAEKRRCGEDPLVGWPSITPTVVQSPPGEPAQLNVMPGASVAYYDIRTTPCQDHDTIRAHLKEILTELAASDPDFKAEIEFIEDRPVVTMERDEPIALEAAKAYRDLTGKEPIYNGVPGATDGTFLRAWKNIPSLVNGPGPRHKPHQTNEYVEIDELVEATRLYVLTAARYLITHRRGS